MGNNASNDQALREHVLALLRGGEAHIDFAGFLADLTLQSANKRFEKLPYTIWHVLEHMRIAQWDILEFSRNPHHKSPDFPKGYWPPAESTANEEAFTKTIQGFEADLVAMQQLVTDPQIDLFAPIPHAEGQTILREALLVADHNSYHLGALLVMKRMAQPG
jgi:hypothetical protein